MSTNGVKTIRRIFRRTAGALGLFVLVLPHPSIHGEPWVPDLGHGTYKNPVLFADYSDPDVVRVGDDFFMTASSFNAVPALPILHSKDLVNWELVNHAVKAFPDDFFDIPQHGNGVFAPSIRFHDGWFFIYWGDPDRGIFRVKTRDPLGEWEAPVRVTSTAGSIDPCPLWEEDGKVYLVHAFAASRAGLNNLLQIVELTPDGSRATRNRRVVFDGTDNHPIIEGPKFLKRNGYYYIFAPAGGVRDGWQTVLRSRNIWGPYEDKIVLAQGDTKINGPHQGAYIELDKGECWFLHFQERQPYGRIVHLQPVRWVDDWPVMGNDADGDGVGKPFLKHAKPSLPESPVRIPTTGDEFENNTLSLAWQWQAQPQPGWFSLRNKQLRLNAVYPIRDHRNLWTLPQLLLQKLPAPAFTAETLLDPSALLPGERGGLVLMGGHYAVVFVQRNRDGKLMLNYAHCEKAASGAEERVLQSIPLPPDTTKLRIRCNVEEGGSCQFSWSSSPEGEVFTSFPEKFQAVEGRWIGAKIGLFAEKAEKLGERGSLDFAYFRID